MVAQIVQWMFARLGLAATILFLLISVVQFLRVLLAVSTKYWPSTVGIVDSIEYVAANAEAGGGDFPRVSYRYEVEGKRFVGRRLWFTARTFAVDRYSRLVDEMGDIHPGHERQVFYLPLWPRIAVLLPGAGFCDLLCLALFSGAAAASAVWWA